jgi:hypothetical protein
VLGRRKRNEQQRRYLVLVLVLVTKIGNIRVLVPVLAKVRIIEDAHPGAKNPVHWRTWDLEHF